MVPGQAKRWCRGLKLWSHPPEGGLRPGGVAGEKTRGVMQFRENVNSTHRTGYWMLGAWLVGWLI